MHLIVGLGNPGKKYEKTRHNVGFMVVDALAKEGKWEYKDKFKAFILKLDKEIIFAKPQTFMNLSGQSVNLIKNFYNFQIPNIWIIHDDIDLPFGTIRIKLGGGSAGHKGVQSIIDNVKTDSLVRFRLGIGHAKNYDDSLASESQEKKDKTAYMQKTEQFVLSKFAKEEVQELQTIIHKTADAVHFALGEGIEKAMNEFN